MTGPMTGKDLARAAEALVGSRYRRQGRDPATGLDCLGVIAAAFAACGRAVAVPGGHGLRLRAPEGAEAVAAAAGLVPVVGPLAPGEVLLLHVGPGQYHLAITTRAGHVHAHAGLRRVVFTPGAPAGAILRRWRLT